MLCQTCPKCQFRLAPGRHICGTCGHVLLTKKEVKPATASVATNTINTKNAKPQKGFWKSLFSFSDDPTPTEQRTHEEPALGET